LEITKGRQKGEKNCEVFPFHDDDDDDDDDEALL